ncbi:ComF family protein [Pseudoclavibacter chungangensis]|uniref:ComF family protein n=1 Tax=Pseudoclavibacter chungangensis TaxID=587635 RepID=A0A7J5C017_9MICO|nr:phosphoribosyltransferase family protein [Pseudoclavibacter chungangensis]KAB1659503.1 ComF family protein [Pseudoclavibacter chungangensis]NYJ67638.1 putative amidophosphoribosyltransferase [Pseudoclavibacter chungangensis]
MSTTGGDAASAAGRVLGRAVRGALAEALAVLVPVACAGCGRPDRALCVPCRAAIRRAVRVHRTRLGALPLVAALPYAGVVRPVLGAFKDDGRTELTGVLAGPLRCALRAALTRTPEPPLLVAAPSRRSAGRRRGYVPLELLCGRAVPGVRVSGALRFGRRVDDQAGLGRAARARNVAGAMRASAEVAGRAVLLVDDVVTTGATAREAARAVAAAEGRPIGVVALALTPRRHDATP